MRSKMFALVAVGLIALGGTAACTNDGNSGASNDSGGTRGGGGGGKVGVILPDTTTSQRWGTDDPKLLKAAFDKADVPVDIQNAQGDKQKFAQIADGMIADGVKVLMIVNLDSGTGKAVLDKAKAQPASRRSTTTGSHSTAARTSTSASTTRPSAELQGNGLVRCLGEKGLRNPMIADLNGSPTDNNATLFKVGYDEVLQPKYDSGTFLKGPDQSVADWDNDEAGVVFQEMWDQTNKKRSTASWRPTTAWPTPRSRS
nr:hypothetical protein GCM10020092_015960 [Actinoplanes digitatis]